MKQLDAFVGTFQCTGKMNESPMGPGLATKRSMAAKIDLDGFWVVAKIDEKKSKESPTPTRGQYAIGYDAAQKKFVASWFDNFGIYCMQSSKGWEGDTFTLDGKCSAMGQEMGARDTFKKEGKSIVHTGEVQMNGKWMMLIEETCKKP